jgi:Protein of unknown function (DUF669)
MVNLNGFDASKVEPSTVFDPIPAGKYLAAIIDSKMKATKSGKGQYLELALQILEGEFKGRQVWARLNLDNPNPQTVKIARGELSAICRAVGVMAPKDSTDLHNLPMVVTVRCKKRQDTGEITNELRGFAKREAASGKPQQAQTDTPPWMRN